MVEGTGIYSKAPYALRLLLADSEAFQELVGAADQGGAIERIHLFQTDDRLDSNLQMAHPRPRAIINLGPGFTYERLGPGTWRTQGSLMLSLEVPFDLDVDTVEEQVITFANTLSEIASEMAALRDSNGGTPISGETHLAVSQFTQHMDPAIVELDDLEQSAGQESYIVAVLQVDWEG